MVLEMSNAPSQRTGATANITPGQQMISSCSGALATAFLTTPFDVIKVRLQAQQQAVIGKPCYLLECTCLDGVTLCTVTPDGSHVRSTRFSGTLDAFLKIAKIEGIGSWWKGLSPTILMAVPATMIYYTGYDQLKVMFGFREGHRNILTPALAGSIARTTAVTVVCPIELIRTKLQSRQGYNNREVLAVVRSAIQQNGILSLWRGLSPMLLRDVPFSVLFWISYEQTKMQLSLLNMNSTFLVPFLAGAISGTVSAIITNPLDVVKTHMQVEIGQTNPTTSGARARALGAGSLQTVIRDVISGHGYGGLFAGLTPRIGKIAPACAIMISSYEASKKYFIEQNSINF